jgi:hypothetical protein
VRNRRTQQPAGILGIRQILKQLFVLLAVGSLFIFVPLHSQSALSKGAPLSKKFRTGEREESSGQATASERLALWLDQVGLSKGQGDTH